MAVTGDRRRRTLFDEDQECYRTSSGNRELRFGRGCVQTSAAVDGGRSFPPTPLFSGPSDGERRSQRWSAHQRSGSPSSFHRYHHLQPSSPPFSSHHHLHTTNPLNSFICDKQRPKNILNPSTNSRIHSHSKHQLHDHYPYHHPSRPHRDQTVDPTPQFHNYRKPPHCDHHLDSIFDSHQKLYKFANTHKNQIGITKINSGFSPKTHRPSQFHDLHHSFNPTRETQSTKTYLQPQNLASTHDTRKKSQISQRRDLLATCPVIQPESDRVSIVDSPHKPNGIFIPQMGTRPNSNSKPKPSLPRNRPITLVDMMQFVSDWFDFEEIWVDESAESERINRSESELSKNEIGDDDFCDVLEDRVVDCVDSVQEKVVDCLDVVKNGGFPGLVKVPSVVSIESVHSVPRIKVTEIEGEDEPLYEPLSLVKLVVSSDCGELIGVENGGLSDLEVTVLVKDSANEDDCNAVAVTQGVQFESSVGAKENVSEVVDDTTEEKLVISCVVMVKAIDLGVVIEAHVGFSEFKIKLERRRQWQIAWAFSACRWTIFLVPLWVWDVLRRDFSVGIYHSRKPNMGLRSIVIQLVLVPRVSTELEVEFFSKKGRLM